VGTFFIKASTYEFMKFHNLGAASTWYYSFEYYGESSLWNFLFPGSDPAAILSNRFWCETAPGPDEKVLTELDLIISSAQAVECMS
jgi:hypothetical protein